MIAQSTAYIDELGARWYVKGGKRYFIQSGDIFRSWRFATVFSISSDELDEVTTNGGLLGFRPGTIVASFADRCFWYIDGKGRYKIGSRHFLKKAGVKWHQVEWASHSDLELHDVLGVIE